MTTTTMTSPEELLACIARVVLVGQLVELLEEDGWAVNRAGEEPFFAVPVEGDNGRWVAAGRALPDGRGLVCYSVFEERFRPERRREAVWRMNEINSGLLYGSFEITSAGEVRLRTCLRTGEPTEEMLREVFYRNIELMDDHLAELRKVYDEPNRGSS